MCMCGLFFLFRQGGSGHDMHILISKAGLKILLEFKLLGMRHGSAVLHQSHVDSIEHTGVDIAHYAAGDSNVAHLWEKHFNLRSDGGTERVVAQGDGRGSFHQRKGRLYKEF